MCGSPPKVSKFHPLWADVSPITAKLATWQSSGRANVLWVTSGNWRMLVNRKNSGDQTAEARDPFFNNAPYDVCVGELALEEISELVRIYEALRPLMKDDGHVLFKTKKAGNVLDGAELFLSLCDFPDVDVSQINFYGAAFTGMLQTLYEPAMRPVATRPLERALIICGLIILAPIVWLANTWALRRDPSLFFARWTTLTVEFEVKRRRNMAPHGDRSRAASGEVVP
jgi:hypothetical protein